jgi:flagellar assembly protein FliH
VLDHARLQGPALRLQWAPPPRHGEPQRVEDVPAELAEEIRQRGYAAGWRDGQEAARRELRDAVACCERLASTLLEVREEMARRMQAPLVELALTVAEVILRRSVQEDRELAVRLARELLERCGASREVLLKVHPRDAEAVRQALEARQGSGHLRVVTDPTVEPGGVIVWDGGVGWDGQPTAMLEWIRENLAQEEPHGPEA